MIKHTKDDSELKRLRQQLKDRLDYMITHGDIPQSRRLNSLAIRTEITFPVVANERPAYWDYLRYYGHPKPDA